jgi:hypothetical protein
MDRDCESEIGELAGIGKAERHEAKWESCGMA